MHRHCLRSSLSSRIQISGRACFKRTKCNNVANASTYAPAESPQASLNDVSPKPFTWKDRKSIAVDKRSSHRPPHVLSTEARKPPVFQTMDERPNDPGDIIHETTLADEEEISLSAFTPGTFVEVRKNENLIQGIVLGETIQDQRWLVMTLTTKGYIYFHYRADVYFSIPNFISASLADRCSTDPAPNKQQIAARAEVLKRLRNLTLKVDRQAQGLQQKPMNVYIEVMSDDPNKWTTTTVTQVTSLLYERPLFMDYYMTHKYLMDRPMQYVAVPGYLKNQTFAVRPRKEIEEIQMVEKHISDYRDQPDANLPYKKFIRRAKQVVAEYDKRKTEKSGPVLQEPFREMWSADDQVFLRFLLRSLQPHPNTQPDPYAMSRTTIIKNVLRPSVSITDSMAHEFAIKLGIIAPWQDLLELSPAVSPWGDFENKKTLEKEANTILRSSSKARAGAILGPMDFLPADPLESVRHDFGDARVFVIDDVSAEELDDGVSVERIPTEPQNHWLHVHIADPAKILHPAHALAKLARQRFSTYYLAQRTYPLLPKALVHDPEAGLSLSERSDGEPTSVLTFSTKVDNEGNILDYTVRAGLIRNIRRASYDDVDLAIGNPPLERRLPFGGTLEVNRGPSLNEQDKADLRLLQKLANDQVATRFRQGVYNFSASKNQVVWNSKIPDHIRSPFLRGSTYWGSPDLTYTVWDTQREDNGSRSLVSEMMKLANRTASRFAVDRNIPVIRRTMEPGVMTPEDLQEILDMRTPSGYVPMPEIVKRLQLDPAGAYTIQPSRHFSLGVSEGEGYCRVTSPLRRFEDMVGHWQIHHALLGSRTSVSAPFDMADLERLTAEFEAANTAVRKLHTSDLVFHSLMYLKRYAEDTARGVERPFGDPLSSMRAWTRNNTRKNPFTADASVIVHLPDLGMNALIEELPPSLKSMPAGTELCVKLDRIDMGLRRNKLVVTPIQS